MRQLMAKGAKCWFFRTVRQEQALHSSANEELGSRILKVNHAGENGAVNIYRGQILAARLTARSMVPELAEFQSHEQRHRAIFAAELQRRGRRRCRSYLLCGLGGLVLGLMTGILGRRAISATTVAVERVVLGHLAQQLRVLRGKDEAAVTAIPPSSTRNSSTTTSLQPTSSMAGSGRRSWRRSLPRLPKRSSGWGCGCEAKRRMATVTLVLLPGMDGTGSLFEPFVAALGNEIAIKVVAYPTTEPRGYEQLESLALAALPPEGPLVLLGESFSGPIAVALAASCPQRIKGLVLCCTFVRNPMPWLAAFKWFAGILPVACVPMTVMSYFLFGRFSTPALRKALERALAQVSPAVFRARLKAVVSVDVSSRLAEVKVPVLCLRASQDRFISPSVSSQIARLCPQTKILAIEGPHCLLQAAPHEAARAIIGFVREAC
jgi:demethoxyubiquinone hydroxylase (CLK1/Coq7/Cat5 family)/pimeloyl-ACP methyl ester carboxylesterase